MQVDDVAVLGEGHDEIRDRRADVADHHTGNDEQGHLAHALREREDETHRQHRAAEGGEDHAGRANHAAAREQTDHRERNGQLRARGDAEHERACDGVGEKGLEQKAGNRQCATKKHGCQNSWKTDVPQDP